MKKTLIKLIILFSVVFILGSCNDPIFFMVHEEIPILKPFIDGSPTNFVRFGDDMYVASGKKIFIFRKNASKWVNWVKLDNRVTGLAATNASLYALYLNKDSDDGRIRNFKSGSDLSLSNVQSIYASGDVLFACLRNDNKYSIHFRKEGASVFTRIPGMSSDSILYGAASNNDKTFYYLCTNEGIYYIEKSQIDTPSNLPDKLPVLEDSNFTGIIELKNGYVAAITKDGKLYNINKITITEAAKFSDERESTGALALWYRYPGDTMPSLLLVGRKEIYYSNSSAYTNGYVEITLDTTDPIDPNTGNPNPFSGRISGTFSDPGKGTPSSIDNYDRYMSSLGKKPVNHIIQTPADINSNMTLFASTQQNGVWSYKDRGKGEQQWNAEE